MGAEAIIGIVTVLVTIIGLVMKARTNRKANRNALGKAEAEELSMGMDRVDRATDKLHPPT